MMSYEVRYSEELSQLQQPVASLLFSAKPNDFVKWWCSILHMVNASPHCTNPQM